ncbi:MAG: phosphotransferase [Acholeplasmataceae bacterium]
MTNCHDNSRSSDDIRIVVILDNTYVIKLASKSLVSENELLEINNLSKRYEATNIKTPKILKTIHNKFSYLTSYKSNPVISYVETYLDFESLESVKSSKIREQINRQVFEHLGLFTEKFKDKYLSTRNSMWSIIDCAPLDKELTEKEENINDLINALNMLKHSDLYEKIKDETTMLLLKIKKEGKKLPQSTIQGDLNSSNIMIHNNQFEGLIDFNLYGKETNINTFLNETMYFLTDDDILNLAPKEILNKMITTQKREWIIF